MNPLVQNGQKLIPSVTRVFRQSQDMYVYLQAYEQGVTGRAAVSRVCKLLQRRNEGF